jgi:hypothetical protein
MLISESTHLAMLRVVGAELVRTDDGEFWAVFHNAYQGVSAGDLDVEESRPALTCRTCDVTRLSLRKDSVLHVRGKDWRVLRPEQSDDEAETVLILKE